MSHSITVIRLVVSVPVLSEQMVVALPIVSHLTSVRPHAPLTATVGATWNGRRSRPFSPSNAAVHRRGCALSARTKDSRPKEQTGHTDGVRTCSAGMAWRGSMAWRTRQGA